MNAKYRDLADHYGFIVVPARVNTPTDKASVMWSLADIHEANGNLMSKNAAFDKQYLAGRYGADLYLERMEEWVMAGE